MFPFSENIQLQNESFHFQKVIKHIWPLLTTERQKKIESVVQHRQYQTSVVLENIYDRGNMSAVIRSAEAFGITLIHSIEPSDKLKHSQRTTAGADKWTELRRWKSTKDCVDELKNEGRKIYATHLNEKAKSLYEIDWSQPHAIVLGNEKNGISQDMIKSADDCVIIPMSGFVQSFNISVAAALCFQTICRTLNQNNSETQKNLNETQRNILKAIYSTRTLDSSFEILKSIKS